VVMRQRRAPGEQGLDVIRVVVPHAVDVEGRRTVHAAPHAAQEVLVDPTGVDMLGQLLVEAIDVEPELLGVHMEVLVAQVPLVLVQEVVHLPEPALGVRRLGGLRRLFGVGM
jgi:hypothetical protein